MSALGEAVLDVRAERLWFHTEIGALPFPESLHFLCAMEVGAGTAWGRTAYAQASAIAPFRTDERNGAMVIDDMLRTAKADPPWPFDLVSVAIDHLGRVVIVDGMHRAAVSAALGQALPARVIFRAQEWVSMRAALHDLNGGPRLYQPVEHVDLAAWPAWRKDTLARAIHVNEVVRMGSHGVDVACNAGTLTCAVARHGHPMLGIDNDRKAIRAARLVAAMAPPVGVQGVEVRFEHCPDFPVPPRADFVMCFSLLNHMLVDGRQQMAQGILQACVSAAPIVFFDCPSPGDPVGGDAPITDPAVMLRWAGACEVTGNGYVLAERGPSLQRTLLVWER